MELENMPSGTRPESEIMFTTHYTGAFDSPSILNRKYYTCKWKGPRNGWVCINNELVDGFDRFDFPWPLKKIGYSKTYSETDGVKLLDNISIEDINLNEFNTFLQDIPSLSSIIRTKLSELDKGDMKAKDFANIIRYLELLAKFAGIIKNVVEKKSINVNIDIPISKCPKCGYIMDIMKEG